MRTIRINTLRTRRQSRRSSICSPILRFLSRANIAILLLKKALIFN